jgi:hypothetical protein
LDKLNRRLLKEKKKEHKTTKYYHYKDMDIKTPYWFLYPLLVVIYWVERLCVTAEKVRRKKLNKWSDKRTERILRHAFPKACTVNTSDNSFYITCRDNAYLLHWSVWSKPWDWYYCNLYNVDILNYLAWNFEMPGYVKTVEEEESYPNNWITVIFKKDNS